MPIVLETWILGQTFAGVSALLNWLTIMQQIFLSSSGCRRERPFWIAIRKIAAIFTTCSISVLIVLGRVFRGGHGGRLMQKTMSTASRGKLMWGIVLVMSMILGGFSVFCIIGNSQNPNSEFNKKRRRSGQ